MRRLLCISALGGAGLLAACGSGGGSSTTTIQAAKALTPGARARVVKKANALCREFNAGVNAGLAFSPTDGSHIYEAFFFQLQNLSSGDMLFDAFIGDGLAIGEAYEELESAVQDSKGPAAVAEAKAGIGKAKAKFNKAARANRIVACAGGPGFKPGLAIPKIVK